MTNIDLQDEGETERQAQRIDGTMGDAQDIAHIYKQSEHGMYCKICGLSKTYTKHL